MSNMCQEKKNDTIKEEYCSKKGIKLLRIPYWEIDNIPEIIKNNLLPIINVGA